MKSLEDRVAYFLDQLWEEGYIWMMKAQEHNETTEEITKLIEGWAK